MFSNSTPNSNKYLDPNAFVLLAEKIRRSTKAIIGVSGLDPNEVFDLTSSAIKNHSTMNLALLCRRLIWWCRANTPCMIEMIIRVANANSISPANLGINFVECDRACIGKRGVKRIPYLKALIAIREEIIRRAYVNEIDLPKAYLEKLVIYNTLINKDLKVELAYYENLTVVADTILDLIEAAKEASIKSRAFFTCPIANLDLDGLYDALDKGVVLRQLNSRVGQQVVQTMYAMLGAISKLSATSQSAGADAHGGGYVSMLKTIVGTCQKIAIKINATVANYLRFLLVKKNLVNEQIVKLEAQTQVQTQAHTHTETVHAETISQLTQSNRTLTWKVLKLTNSNHDLAKKVEELTTTVTQLTATVTHLTSAVAQIQGQVPNEASSVGFDFVPGSSTEESGIWQVDDVDDPDDPDDGVIASSSSSNSSPASNSPQSNTDDKSVGLRPGFLLGKRI